jgi:hypothetical protein
MELENLTIFIIEASSGLTSERNRKNETKTQTNADSDKITRERAEKLDKQIVNFPNGNTIERFK